ncbi:hypothetical protein GF312_02285 [Candidatus Poribacteria bacterium]|nr:hypothetical protein [Candidatus Poribacteria bacterium]
MANMNNISISFQPMTVREILRRSFRIYKSNYIRFIGTILLIKGSYLILGYIIKEIIVFIVKGPNPDTLAPETMIYVDYLIDLGIKAFELFFITPFLVGILTISISSMLLNKKAGIVDVYSRLSKKILPLIGTVFITGVMMAVVFFMSASLGLSMIFAGSQPGLLVVIAGMFMTGVLLVWYAFISQAVIFEGEGGIGAMKRSKYLVKGSFARTFLLVIVSLIAITFAAELASLGVYQLFSLFGSYGITLAGGASEGVSNIISVIVEPLRIIIIIILYYDFRIRKEGYDPEIMAQEFKGITEKESEV